MKKVVVTLLLVATVVCADTGPELDSVPEPFVPPKELLPPPAQWPVLRYEQPLRMLVALHKIDSAGRWQRISRRLRAQLELQYYGGGDDQYHVHDKWIEPDGSPTRDEIFAAGVKGIRDSLVLRDGKLPYDVVVCAGGQIAKFLNDDLLQKRLREYVEAGGLLVMCTIENPPVGEALRDVWPGLPDHGYPFWAKNGNVLRTNSVELAGAPLHQLTGWCWDVITKPADNALVLMNTQQGSIFTRRAGRGTIVYVAPYALPRFYDMIEQVGRQHDRDEIWLRAGDQLLFSHVRGGQAFPAWCELRASTNRVFSAQVVNQSWRGPLVYSVHVTTPRGVVVYSEEKQLDLPPGERRTLDVRVPVDPAWGAGWYPVCLTIGDPVGKKQIHQALDWIVVPGALDLKLTSAKPGYRLGESASFTLTAKTGTPWSGTFTFGVYDFRGRLLALDERPVSLTNGTQNVAFSWRLADHGVRVDTMWAQVVAKKDGVESGRAEAKFYKYEPWSMRNEYQWSTWARIACDTPSVIPRSMQLMAHAGMNALGYPGANELWYPAERWSWRFYNEGIGMNTFAPVIEYENDTEIEAQLRKELAARPAAADLRSAAFVLASVGEEAGYKNGWGTRYYWDTPVAPAKACRAFHWFLKQKYPALAQLNTAWKSNFQAWDEVKLTREFSTPAPTLDADGWAHPKASPLGAGVTGVSFAPYSDTAEFYDWYYDRLIDIAKRLFREQINPVAVIMASCHTLGTTQPHDVRLCAPLVWNECQQDAVFFEDGPAPGYGLTWGHLDATIKMENEFWAWLLMRSGHNNHWVDVPLMFNNDLTHTRASFALRKWTQRLAGHERIILDSRPLAPEVGLLTPNGFGPDVSRANMAISLRVALTQAGFGLPALNPTNLQPYKAIFAIGHDAVSSAEAARLAAYVERGGTLVFTARFAGHDQFGGPAPTIPGQGLAERWGYQVAKRTESIPQNHDIGLVTANLDPVGERFRGLKLASFRVFRDQVKQTGWTELARYDDGTPAVLTRAAGKGRLICLNAVYRSHWYIQWLTPTDAERQGFYRLVEWICEQAGVTRRLRLDGDPREVLHLVAKQFTDSTGDINYVILRTSAEVPWVRGQFTWLGSQTVAYDVLDGGTVGKQFPLHFRPGAGKLLAFVEKPVKTIKLRANSITAGEPLRLTIQIRDARNKPVPGAFPLELRVESHPGLSRSFSAQDGDTFTLNTALSEPPGPWTITVTDGITGLSGSTRVVVKPGRTGPDWPSLGWPSEIEEPAQLSPDQFIAKLRELSALYRQDHSSEGWMIKQRLGYYYDYFPNTRHTILRPLNDVDWPAYSAAIHDAVTNGDTFILTGEDIGLDPATGLTTYPHHDARQLEGVIAALRDAQWTLASPDGDTIAATLGKGRVVLCRESVDAVGDTSPTVANWQRRWLATQTVNAPISTPTLAKLQHWWTGQEAITDKARQVTWFHGNSSELKFHLEPNKALVPPMDCLWDGGRTLITRIAWPTSTEGTIFCLVVPPTGDVKEVSLTITGEAQFDVGRDGTVDADWTSAVAQAARTTPYRDGNGWRIIPVQVTTTRPAEVKLSGLKISVR